MGRKSKSYDGTEITSKALKDLLPTVFRGLQKSYVSCFQSIVAVWPNLVGTQTAISTTPTSLQEGILTVVVRNSTLYCLLSRYEKMKIIKQIKNQFPKSDINDIIFRMG